MCHSALSMDHALDLSPKWSMRPLTWCTILDGNHGNLFVFQHLQVFIGLFEAFIVCIVTFDKVQVSYSPVFTGLYFVHRAGFLLSGVHRIVLCSQSWVSTLRYSPDCTLFTELGFYSPVFTGLYFVHRAGFLLSGIHRIVLCSQTWVSTLPY